jgi:Protein of unknown function (DUF2442)
MEQINQCTDAAIANARAEGARSLSGHRAVGAQFLPDRNKIEIDLDSGWSIQVPTSFSALLAAATPAQRAQIEIVDMGLGLHWAEIDEDWYVPAVVDALSFKMAA